MFEPTPMYASELRPPEQVDMLRHNDMRQAYQDIPAWTYPIHMPAPPYLVLRDGRDPLRDFKWFEYRDDHWFDNFRIPKGFEMAGPPDERPPFEAPDFDLEVDFELEGIAGDDGQDQVH